MKVTRPPGRDPASNAACSRAKEQDKLNAPNGPQATALSFAIEPDSASEDTAPQVPSRARQYSRSLTRKRAMLWLCN